MAQSVLSRPEDDEGAELEQRNAASGTVSGAAETTEAPSSPPPNVEFFITDARGVYAGRHTIIDLWDAEALADLDHVRHTLIAAAQAAGATVLGHDFHHFQPNGGVSGVVVLAESHISIHTWPEARFAAVDVFMCGTCDPEDTLPVLRQAFRPARHAVQTLRRGVMPRPKGEASA